MRIKLDKVSNSLKTVSGTVLCIGLSSCYHNCTFFGLQQKTPWISETVCNKDGSIPGLGIKRPTFFFLLCQFL